MRESDKTTTGKHGISIYKLQILWKFIDKLGFNEKNTGKFKFNA